MTQHTLHVADIGRVAARALTAGAHGTVEATFDRSFYVTIAGFWICVGPLGLGAGPLNARCEFWSGDRMLSDVLSPGDGALIARCTMRVGRTLAVFFETSKEWSAPALARWSAGTLAHGLECFAGALPVKLPSDGLAALLSAGHPGQSLMLALATQAARHLEALVQCSRLCDGHQIDTSKLAPLLGFGPGLTPSGDDFLGGALIALHLLGLTHLRDAIWTALKPLLSSATNDISVAHLAAAAEGYGSEALHLLLNDVITGHAKHLAARIQVVAAIGHTSGWDALAGAVTVLRAYCAAST